jgi:peptidoglycan/LPS O-acetylase OafA/YrhL
MRRDTEGKRRFASVERPGGEDQFGMWSADLFLIGPFWSRAIEEQFHLIWPMVV